MQCNRRIVVVQGTVVEQNDLKTAVYRIRQEDISDRYPFHPEDIDVQVIEVVSVAAMLVANSHVVHDHIKADEDYCNILVHYQTS